MTQQIRTSTTGELSASIKGYDEFNARNVEFMGSKNDLDFLLRGMDDFRGLIFYFSRFKSGRYELGADSANKAFYEVGGALYGEVKEGFVDVTVEADDAVSISFDFSIEEKVGAALIRIKGSGNFKGRVPWTDNGRALSSGVCGVDDPHVMLDPPPEVRSPKGGEVEPVFTVYAIASRNGVHQWESRVMVGANVVKADKFPPAPDFRGYLIYGENLTNLIPPGTGFYIMARYNFSPFSSGWSQWGRSADLEMIIKPCEILLPAANSTISPFALISGKGNPKAVVELYESDFGVVLYGTAVVGDDGNWQATPDKGLRPGPFRLIALQRINGVSRWSKDVGYTVTASALPEITTPKSGETLSYRGFVGGAGTPGYEVKLFQHGDPNTVYSYADVQDNGTWYVSMRRDLPLGPFSMTANQTKDGVVSDWAVPVNFIVVDKKP